MDERYEQLMTKVLLLFLLVLGVDAQSTKSEISKNQLRLTEAFYGRVTLVDRDGTLNIRAQNEAMDEMLSDQVVMDLHAFCFNFFFCCHV